MFCLKNFKFWLNSDEDSFLFFENLLFVFQTQFAGTNRTRTFTILTKPVLRKSICSSQQTSVIRNQQKVYVLCFFVRNTDVKTRPHVTGFQDICVW